jgi:hypothetical protein
MKMKSPWEHHTRVRRLLSLLALLTFLGCDSPVDLESRISACTDFEFGNAGCAALIVFLDEPEQRLSKPHLLQVRASWDGGGIISHASEPQFGAFVMVLDLGPFSLIQGGDTADLWVTAKVVSMAQEDLSTDSTVILAQDSVLRQVTFASVGDLPLPDTVRLRPR